MPESPDAARLQQIRAAATESGWWTINRPNIELLITEIDRLTAELDAAVTAPCDAEGCAIQCTPYCPNGDDNRRRLWSDGKGQAWIEHCMGDDGTPLVSKIDTYAYGDVPLAEIEKSAGPIRLIGRTW